MISPEEQAALDAKNQGLANKAANKTAAEAAYAAVFAVVSPFITQIKNEITARVDASALDLQFVPNGDLSFKIACDDHKYVVVFDVKEGEIIKEFLPDDFPPFTFEFYVGSSLSKVDTNHEYWKNYLAVAVDNAGNLWTSTLNTTFRDHKSPITFETIINKVWPWVISTEAMRMVNEAEN
ncbi:MAG: hypothetical protein EOP53_13390 [Sphingobacteriales bacterium]|nr:MAG: hypothetical protein EOP53_13390 [Sphingobacteriales bacterium]